MDHMKINKNVSVSSQTKLHRLLRSYRMSDKEGVYKPKIRDRKTKDQRLDLNEL